MSSIIHYGDGVHARRIRATAVASALAVLAAGCGADSAGTAAESSSAAPTSYPAPPPTAGCAAEPVRLAADAATIDISPATVAVTDPGAGPRRLFTLAPTATAASELFTNSLQVSQVADGEPSGGNRDVTVPLVAQPTCSDPLDIGVYFGAPSSSDDALTKALAIQQGQRATVRLAANGEVRSFTLAAPAGATPESQQALEQALVQTFLRVIPLPSEAVGPGARWTVTRTIRGDSNLTQTMQVTIGGTPEQPSLTADVDEEPNDSIFRVPGSDTTLTIASYTMAGRGSATVDPTRAFPLAGGVQLEGGRTLVGDDPGRTLTQKTGNVYRWTAK